MSIELSSRWVKVRKEHVCDWCGEPIAAGESARRRSGIHEGVFYDCRQHPECWEAMMNSDPWCEEYRSHEQKRGMTMDEQQ